MQTLEYKTIDRAGWESGPWDSEPDKVQWPDPATGLPCLAVRHPNHGHWCGYVGVQEGHPAFGKGYDDVDVGAHGGLTFAAPCNPAETAERGICHVPEPGEPDHVWWFGFDCHHAWDRAPGMEAFMRSRNMDPLVFSDTHYRTLEYVKAECANLAAQLAKDPASS